MATRLDRGYRPPSVATGIGQALGGMGEALMRISSMQSDRVDRAYELARQNRIDERQIQQIDLDTKRLEIETQRHRDALERANREDRTRDEELTRKAAETWYNYQTEDGAFIRMNEQGVPVATDDDVIARIKAGQGIQDITDFNPELSQSFREGMALAEAQHELETTRGDELIAQGMTPSGVPFSAEQIATRNIQFYDPNLRKAFDNTPEGRAEHQRAMFDQQAMLSGAEAFGEMNPDLFTTDEQKLASGLIQVLVEGESQPRWINPIMIDMAEPLGLAGKPYQRIK